MSSDGHTDDVYGLDELLGAYALDAVDGDERRRVEEYLAINPRAAAEVQEHREVATMLAFTGMDAPNGVWSKILDELGATDEPPAPGPELARVLASGDANADDPEGDDRSGSAWRRSALVGAGALSLGLVLVGGVFVFGGDDDSAGDGIETAFEAALESDDAQRIELTADGADVPIVTVIEAGGRGYVDASGLPALTADQTYQLWGELRGSDAIVSIGILGPDPEIETFTVDAPIEGLVITIEDEPGVVSDGNPVGAYRGTLD